MIASSVFIGGGSVSFKRGGVNHHYEIKPFFKVEYSQKPIK